MVANSTLAKSIDKRIEVSAGETKVFNHVNAANLATQDNDGGVIYNAGTVTIGDASSFTDNSISGDGSGGVIYNEEGKINISDSIFEGNTATGTSVSSGGAIYNNARMDEEHNPAAILKI